jgi:hypothetical protein
MLARLAACIVSFGLLSTAAGSANAPQPVPVVPTVVEARMPMRALPDRADVKKALAKRRAKNLAAFRAYRKAGIYPHNTYRVGPLNIWRDEAGHLCAAATMIFKDGKVDLVKTTGDTNNNIRLMNVTEGPLLDWIMTSGFTIEEIDRIQLPDSMPEQWNRNTEEDYRREDAKLAVNYAKTDKYLVAHAKAGLDRALDRVMHKPELAWALVDGTI